MKKILFFVTSTLMLSLSAPLMSQDTAIKWMTFEEVQIAMEKEPKSIFIDVYTDWCGWCKRMDASTFKDVEVIKLLNTYFYPVKFNAEQKGDVNFKGYNFKYVNRGRRGVNELASTLLDDKLSYPSYVALNEKYERITIIKGYQTTSDFLPMLRYLGEKHYLTQNWKDFRASVKGD